MSYNSTPTLSGVSSSGSQSNLFDSGLYVNGGIISIGSAVTGVFSNSNTFTGTNVFTGPVTLSGGVTVTSFTLPMTSITGFGTNNWYVGSATTSLTGINNISIGANHAASITSGNGNITIGALAGGAIAGTNYNVYIGYNSGLNVSGTLNVALGAFTLSASGTNSTGSTTAIGRQCMQAGVNLSSCTGVGYTALNNITGVTGATAIGVGAGGAATSCHYSTYLGYNTTGNFTFSTAIGANAVLTANNQIMVGTSAETVIIPGPLTLTAGPFDMSAVTVGNIPIKFIKADSLANWVFGATISTLTTGHDNYVWGTGSGIAMTVGYSNIIIGTGSCTHLTTGTNNTNIGPNNGNAITTGYNNLMIGSSLSVGIITGNGNTSVGSNCGSGLNSGCYKPS